MAGLANMIISGYRAVWIFAMFDLPTDTDKARKDYTHFRKNLLKDGFAMLQYSVYARHCEVRKMRTFIIDGYRIFCRLMVKSGWLHLLINNLKRCGFSGEKCENQRLQHPNSSNYFEFFLMQPFSKQQVMEKGV